MYNYECYMKPKIHEPSLTTLSKGEVFTFKQNCPKCTSCRAGKWLNVSMYVLALFVIRKLMVCTSSLPIFPFFLDHVDLLQPMLQTDSAKAVQHVIMSVIKDIKYPSLFLLRVGILSC